MVNDIYGYGMRLRGFAPGCQPMKGLIDWKDLDEEKCGYYSLLYYDRKLTEQEVRDYELDYLGIKVI